MLSLALDILGKLQGAWHQPYAYKSYLLQVFFQVCLKTAELLALFEKCFHAGRLLEPSKLIRRHTNMGTGYLKMIISSFL